MGKPEELKWVDLPVEIDATLVYMIPKDSRQKIMVRWVDDSTGAVTESEGNINLDGPRFMVNIERAWHRIYMISNTHERVLAWASME